MSSIAAVARVVPRVFSDVTRDSPVGFSENGNDYEEARQAVLRAIAARATQGRTAASTQVSPESVHAASAQSQPQSRKRPPMPAITKPVMFDTPEADAILSALQVFPPDNPWNQDISSLPVHADSAAIIARIGADKPLEYNLDMGFIIVPANQRRVDVKLLEYPAESDPGPYPVPDNAPIENWPMQKNEHAAAVTKPGQTLEQLQREGTGDRHIIVVDPGNGKLYEFWQSRKTDAGWQASNEATFDLRTGALRPERWTSGDAAGLPIFPAVVRYDEVERGIVEHAMRFTVRRTRRAYVLPATHWASPHKDRDLPRMGERFRLRQDFDISGFPPHAQAILRGLKKYGMFVADNGADWYMSIAPDRRFKGLETLSRVKGLRLRSRRHRRPLRRGSLASAAASPQRRTSGSGSASNGSGLITSLSRCMATIPTPPASRRRISIVRAMRIDQPRVTDALTSVDAQLLEAIDPLCRRRDDLADPIRRKCEERNRWHVWHSFRAPASQVRHEHVGTEMQFGFVQNPPTAGPIRAHVEIVETSTQS